MGLGKRVFNAFLVFLFAIVLFIISYGIADIKNIPSINKTNILRYKDGRGVVVAVIDTGLNIDDTINENRVELIEQDITDDFGHGTQIVSLIQNNTNDNVTIIPIKVTDSDGIASMKSVCDGIRKAVDSGANIINLSMNMAFYADATEFEKLVNELYENGIYVIVSAGNDGEDTRFLTPANIENAIVVGAMTEEKEPYYFSNYGSSIDISALGVYNGKLGTSFACAYVTSYCAQLMSNGCDDIEAELYKHLDKISEKEYGQGYLEWQGQYVGENNSESEIYVGKRNRTLNEKTFDILDVNWRALSQDELDAIIGETDYKYVGLLLSRLEKGEIEELKNKSRILNTNIDVLRTKYDETAQDYVVTNQTEKTYIDYCLNAYKAEVEKCFITSDWDCRTTEAIFYLSSPDRQKIYKYTITGLYGHSWVINPYARPEFTNSDLSLISSVYRDNATTYSFTRPTPTRISTFIPNIRATRTDAYKNDGTFLWTQYSWNYIMENCDDALPYVGISISFNNYTNKKTGYHNSEYAISMYNAGNGIGSSTEEAKSYNYLNASYGGSPEYPQKSYLTFNTIELGYVNYWYRGVFKDGYNYFNATTIEESLSSWLTDRRTGIYLSTGQSSINDTTGTFTLNAVPPIGFGTKWYGTGDNVLYADSHIPEIVFNLAPNKYTIKYHGNGSDSGGMADTTMTYDSAAYLSVNQFSRSGYKFKGWATSANGKAVYTNEQHVINLTAQNNGIFNLYAVWEPLEYTVRYHGNGATSGEMPDTTMTYDKTQNLAANTYEKAGYKFKGWAVSADGEAVYTDSQSVKNLVKPGGTVDLYAVWKPVSYTITYHGNGATNGSMPDMSMMYDTAAHLSANSFTKIGYTFQNWNTKADGSGTAYADRASVKNLTVQSGAIVTLYAQWKVNQYTIVFHGNGGTGSMESITAVYDMPIQLLKNTFEKETEYGMSVFKGWNRDAESLVSLYPDGDTVLNLTVENNGTVNLYAVWDDCPWILAENLYYTLNEAQNGEITYDELMSQAAAEDREDGSDITHGTDAEKGTSFTIIDYQETDFTQFQQEGSVTETYQVIDSAGNKYKQMITVYIVDTTAEEIKPVGTMRFINEKYYNKSYEEGGLEEHSVWKTDLEYIETIQKGFENSRNDTPIWKFRFSHEEVEKMKAFAETNGIGNFGSEDALQRFYDEFMVPNMVN